ncbi:MAG: hypothetical protein MMC33_005421 [Icmadophila ericetorum]|nr:hypothetical protein [Icmadophila ericetorum]
MEMVADPNTTGQAAVVDQQPAVQQSMTPEGAKMSLRGGGEGEDVCCGICAGIACFECCECCC